MVIDKLKSQITRVCAASISVWMTAGCALPAAPPSLPRGGEAPVGQETLTPLAPGLVDEAFRSRCAKLFTSTIYAAVAKASADGPPSTEAVAEVSRVLDEAQACVHANLLPKDDYRAVLMGVRALIGAWYDGDPSVHAIALSGDRSGLLQFGSTLEPLPNARGIAEYYLFTESELRRIDGKAAVPLTGDRLKSGMLLVDAATGVSMNLLEQQTVMSALRVPLEKVLEILGDGLRAEADAWSRDIIPREGPTKAAYISPSTPTKPLSLDTRFFFVSSYVRNLAAIWGERGNDVLRDSLGRPYAWYLQTLYEAVERSEPKKDFQWVVPVEVAVEKGYRHFFRARLDRLVRETLFDNYNVRSLFALREAEATWVSLLAPARTRVVSDDEVASAAYQLLSAAATADSPRSKLEGLARVLRVARVLDGREGEGHAPLDPKDPRSDGRRRASRQLAEVALCTMNQAYLTGPALSRACAVSFDRATQVLAARPCSADPIAIEFDAGAQGVPPITEETRAAYESILGILDIHWDLRSSTNSGAFGAAPAESTSCELGRLLHSVALGRLAVSVSTYQHIVHLLGDARAMAPPDQVGPVVSSAFSAVARERAGICGVVGTYCNLDELERAHKLAPRPNQNNIAQEIGLYCNATLIGADIFSVVSSTKRGPSLLTLSRPHLRPLDASAIQAAGLMLRAEAAACADRSVH